MGLPDSLIGRAADFGSAGCRFDSYSGIDQNNMMPCSSTVERSAVNGVVVGSSPTGAVLGILAERFMAAVY